MFWKIDDLGDVLAWYSRTPYGGEWIVTVWRASNRRWEPLDSFPEANLGQFDLSASGWVAVNVQTALPSQQAYIYSPTGQRWALRTDGACPGTNADATGSTVDLVNDEGLAHGWIDCAGERFPVRWTLGGRAEVLDHVALALDNYGNTAGEYPADATRRAIWLADGTPIWVTDTAGGLAFFSKFFKRGYVFGYIDWKAAIWRFGF
jgi:hypothetical protein